MNFVAYSESGFNPYNDVVFTSRDYLASHKAELKTFLETSIQGWHDYMSDVRRRDPGERGDPQGQQRAVQGIGVVRVGRAAQICRLG